MRVIILFGFLFSVNAMALIYGKPAPVGAFPFVGENDVGCTMTKVGPRHFLTAAHCAYSKDVSKVNFSFYAGNMVKEKTYKFSGKVFIHPSWTHFMEICQECDGSDDPENDDLRKSDIALFIANKESPEIPWADIAFNTFKTDGSVKVILAGYGCTEGIKAPGDESDSSLRYNETYLEEAEILDHKGSLYRGYEEEAASSNWLTLAYGSDKTLPALCPGDSGGPMLKKDTAGKWRLIGIAHNYTFKAQYETGIPMTNLHSRLDNKSYNKIGAWIRSKWD